MLKFQELPYDPSVVNYLIPILEKHVGCRGGKTSVNAYVIKDRWGHQGNVESGNI